MNQASGQSLRIATALAWEFAARSWRGILLGPLAAVAFLGLIFGLLLSQRNGPQDLALIRFTLSLVSWYWMTVLSLGSFLLVVNFEKPRLRYTLPASSFLLVGCPMACAMLTIFAEYALVALLLNAWLDVGWPVWGPGLLAAVLIAWFQAVFWSTSNSLGVRCLVWLVSFVALALAIARAPLYGHTGDGQTMDSFLPSVGGWQALSFGLATLACVGVGTAGFARQRHGSGVELRRIVDWLGDQFYFWKAACPAPFASPPAAQFWREWTERGYVLPAGTALAALATLAAAPLVSAVWRHGHPIRWALAASALLVAPLLVVGFFLGSRSRDLEFGAFSGSRPLSDRQIATAILKSMTLGLISSAVIWAAFITLVALASIGLGALIAPEDLPRFFRAAGQADVVGLLARGALVALVAWSVVGFITSLALAGPKVTTVASFLAFGVVFGGLILDRCLPSDFRSVVLDAYARIWFGLLLLGCAATFVTSRRRHLISTATLFWAAAIVLIALGAEYALELINARGFPLSELCWCALIPIPLAAAPLAVYVNRHR